MKNIYFHIKNKIINFVENSFPCKAEKNFKEIEKEILNDYEVSIDRVPVVFILASPRTGSTVFYQLMIKILGLTYFSNFVDKLTSNTPIVGFCLEQNLKKNNQNMISLKSNYGKTECAYEPSEATVILSNWFDWKHPTETHGKNLKKNQQIHLEKTIASMYSITKQPIVIKNAWNGYRIKELCNVFKNCYFVWLRRDIIDSSYSDLKARKRKGNPSNVWSSTTPKNYKELQKLHYTKQVVENQFLFNRKVEDDLIKYVARDKYCEIWYEDLDTGINSIFSDLAHKIQKSLGIILKVDQFEINEVNIKCSKVHSIDDDYVAISDYAISRYPNYLKN